MNEFNKASIDSIFRIIQQINNREKLAQKERNKTINKKTEIFFWSAFISFGVSLIFGLANKWFLQNKILSGIFLILLFVSYLFMLLQPLVMVWLSRTAIYNLIVKPFDYFLESIKWVTRIDCSYIYFLEKKELDNLKFVKDMILTEKQSITKRMNSLYYRTN